MSNSFFSFKRFTVHQDNCAMKVCTDACLLGAMVAGKLGEAGQQVHNILDIGTGTGLLSLMLAQKTNAIIDAVEINEAASRQAHENFKSSPWAKRMQVHHTGIQHFIPAKKYDSIISNPPFFEEDLQSPDTAKNDAKHDTALTLEELVRFIKSNLSQQGNAFLLLPFHRTTYLQSLAHKQGLFVKEVIFIRQSIHHSFFRTIVQLSIQSFDITQREMSIHDENRQYTPEFTGLLKDYYLKL